MTLLRENSLLVNLRVEHIHREMTKNPRENSLLRVVQVNKIVHVKKTSENPNASQMTRQLLLYTYVVVMISTTGKFLR